MEKRIDIIPWRLQASYKPDGLLSIIISDRLYIDFSSPNNFDNSFKNFNNNLSTSDNDDTNREQKNRNNDQILRDLFEQSRNQTELLEKMTDFL